VKKRFRERQCIFKILRRLTALHAIDKKEAKFPVGDHEQVRCTRGNPEGKVYDLVKSPISRFGKKLNTLYRRAVTF
jgi:hypothetical protein